jgi:hypothetical protein
MAGFTHEVFGMDPNTLEWIQIEILAPDNLLSKCIFTDQLFLSGIATRGLGYHHVNYFNGPKLRGAYNDFYGKALQVVDVNVLTFTTHI